MKRTSPAWLLGVSCVISSLALGSCAADSNTDKHNVYFVGYVYNGATGQRLAPGQITGISIKYRDQLIHTKLDADGRFVSQEPLPTWQDYSVYIGAPGFRPFVSDNPGIDVPKSLSMTDGLAGTITTQTFHIDASLFPVDLKTPKLTINIEKSDAAITMPAPARASGTIRLRPQSLSLLDRGATDLSGIVVQPRWPNDEDLLNQTVSMPFSDGTVQIAPGALVYGVAYEVAVFDVEGYQPVVRSGQSALSAGSVSSLSVTLTADLKEPLRILSTTAQTCLPPLVSSTDFGAAIDVTFSEDIEAAGPTLAEDIDNGLSITTVAGSSFSTCSLNVSVDPSKQERGTRSTINGKVLTLAFNPSIGIATTGSSGLPCTAPTGLTSVTYGSLANIFVQPKSDPVRKRSIQSLLQELPAGSSFGVSSLSCPGRSSTGF
jgi:hypothetical protein